MDEDPQFALSISDPHVGLSAADEDSLDCPVFDNDLALSADALSQGLAAGDNFEQSTTGEGPNFDDRGDFVISGGLDDELTDDDAEGETDPELDADNSEGDIVANYDLIDALSDALGSNGNNLDEFQDPSIILVLGAQLPIYGSQYYLDQPACRFVLVFIFSATLFLSISFYRKAFLADILAWLFDNCAANSITASTLQYNLNSDARIEEQFTFQEVLDSVAELEKEGFATVF